MEMAFLVLWINSATAVIPQPYRKSECEQVLKSWGKGGYCIAAPSSDDVYYNCTTSVPDMLNPGRYTIAKTHCDLPTGNIVKGNKEK